MRSLTFSAYPRQKCSPYILMGLPFTRFRHQPSTNKTNYSFHYPNVLSLFILRSHSADASSCIPYPCLERPSLYAHIVRSLPFISSMKVTSMISSTSDVDKEDICHGGGWYFGRKYVGLFPPRVLLRERERLFLFIYKLGSSLQVSRSSLYRNTRRCTLNCMKPVTTDLRVNIRWCRSG